MAHEPDKVGNAEALAITAVSTALGFPVPPTIAKNVFSSVAALIGSAVDVPVAWLQAKAQAIRSEASARATFTAEAVGVAAKKLGTDDALAERATLFLGGRLLREQGARERITREAVEDLKEHLADADADREIDEDWLHMFARIAETKTNTDVQTYFARVLAGEIRKPGSFAPETIDVLAKLSPGVGLSFQQLCSMTAQFAPMSIPVIFTEPFGQPGSGALAPVGFSYSALSRLQDAGLVRGDLSTTYTIPTISLRRLWIGGQLLQFRIATSSSETMEPSIVAPPTRADLLTPRVFRVILLTEAGVELRRIVHMTPNDIYIAKFVEWAAQLELVPE